VVSFLGENAVAASDGFDEIDLCEGGFFIKRWRLKADGISFCKKNRLFCL
jgi:hypothetical protein